jgi:hypothetical protein
MEQTDDVLNQLIQLQNHQNAQAAFMSAMQRPPTHSMTLHNAPAQNVLNQGPTSEQLLILAQDFANNYTNLRRAKIPPARIQSSHPHEYTPHQLILLAQGVANSSNACQQSGLTSQQLLMMQGVPAQANTANLNHFRAHQPVVSNLFLLPFSHSKC